MLSRVYAVVFVGFRARSKVAIRPLFSGHAFPLSNGLQHVQRSTLGFDQKPARVNVMHVMKLNHVPFN